MKIHIKTNVGLPEVGSEMEMDGGTLRDLLLQVFTRLGMAQKFVDRKTGEMNFEGLFEVRLNNVSYHSLEEGLDRPLKDGDEVQINLLLFGGG